jgi:hypothetical protein
MAAMGTRQCGEVDEPGPLRLGSHGRVGTAIGVPLPFTITQFDAGRSWAWEVAGIAARRRRRATRRRRRAARPRLGERFGSAAEALQSKD